MARIVEEIARLKRLPYSRKLQQQEDGSWGAWVPELPGCIGGGETQDKALAMLEDAMSAWLEVALRHGDPIPEPLTDDSYSGKLVLRLGAGLHRDAADAAEARGLSLNAFIVEQVARAVGVRTLSAPPGKKKKTAAHAISRR